MRRESANAIRDRYAMFANKDKRRILDEFVAATGFHEKSANRILNTPPGPRCRQTRQPPSSYNEAAFDFLIVLWEGMMQTQTEKPLSDRHRARHSLFLTAPM